MYSGSACGEEVRRLALACLLCALAAPAFAQGIPAEVTLKLSREQIMTIGSGLSELPYKVAAPLLQAIQGQIAAQEPKPKLAPAPVLGPPPKPPKPAPKDAPK